MIDSILMVEAFSKFLDHSNNWNSFHKYAWRKLWDDDSKGQERSKRMGYVDIEKVLFPFPKH